MPISVTTQQQQKPFAFVDDTNTMVLNMSARNRRVTNRVHEKPTPIDTTSSHFPSLGQNMTTTRTAAAALPASWSAVASRIPRVPTPPAPTKCEAPLEVKTARRLPSSTLLRSLNEELDQADDAFSTPPESPTPEYVVDNIHDMMPKEEKKVFLNWGDYPMDN